MRVLRVACLVVVTVLVWLSLVVPPWPVAAYELDPSWAQAYGHALKNGLRMGVDLIFTFGPLGYFHQSAFDQDLFDAVLRWEIYFKAAVAFVLVAAGVRIRSACAKWCWFLLIILITVSASDAVPYLCGMVLVHRAVRFPPGWFYLTFAASLLATISLIKFSFFLFSVLVIAALIVLAWRRARRLGVFTAIWFASSFLFGWVLCGQSPADLPVYLLESSRIASGYSAAMSIWGSVFDLACVVAALAGAVVLLWCWFRAGVDRGVAAVLFALGLFMAFKAGFVTQDVHVLTAFGVIGPFALLLEREPDRETASRRFHVALVSLVVVAAVAGSLSAGGDARSWLLPIRLEGLKRSAVFMARPNATRMAFLEVQARREAEFGLPRIRDVVGDEPVDIIDWEQGILFLNHLNWRPRPVLHSYMTYTPELMLTNADFLLGDRAPRFLIMQIQQRYDWLPMMADASLLEVVARDFQTVIPERQYLLVERKPRPHLPLATRLPPTREITVRLGEDLRLDAPPGHTVHVALDIRLNLAGRLRNFLYKPPPVYLTLFLGEGRSEQFRIVPGMMKTGIQISPLILTANDFHHYTIGSPLPEVAVIRVEPSPGRIASYQEQVRVKLWITERQPRD